MLINTPNNNFNPKEIVDVAVTSWKVPDLSYFVYSEKVQILTEAWLQLKKHPQNKWLVKLIDEISSNWDSVITKIDRLNYNYPQNNVISWKNMWEVIDEVSKLIALDDDWWEIKKKIAVFTWTPWSWKWCVSYHWANYMWVKLEHEIKEKLVMEIWSIHEDTNTHVAYVWLDIFFDFIGKKRRTEMLRSVNDFIRRFSDNPKALRFIEKYLSTYKDFEFDEKVYTRGPGEKTAEAALSALRVVNKENTDRSIIILDWIDINLVEDIAKSITDKEWKEVLEIIKMMVFPRLELAFQWVTHRDVELWKQDPKDVTKFRFEEWYYLLEEFLLKAMRQGDYNMIDISLFTDKKLDKSTIRTMLNCFKECQDELSEKHSDSRFDLFLTDIVDKLTRHFEKLDRNPTYFYVNKKQKWWLNCNMY